MNTITANDGTTILYKDCRKADSPADAGTVRIGYRLVTNSSTISKSN